MNISNKRKHSLTESSDSESEVSFNLNGCEARKRPRKEKSKMGTEEDDLFAKISKLMDAKTDEINLRLSTQLAPLEKKVNNNASSIDEIKKAIARIENGSTLPNGKRSRDPVASGREENFLKSRRSGRFWPIEGTSDEQLLTNVMTFLLDILLVPKDWVTPERIQSVRRTRTAYSSKIKNEVLVTFHSASERDYVFSHAKNLANSVGPRKNGLRLDYPAHLGSDYRALDSYGARLRREAGEGFRHNIRFNDDEMGLFLDINFGKESKWIRVTPKMAKEQRDEMTVEGEEEARQMIKAGLQNAGSASAGVLSGANAAPVAGTDWRLPRTNNLGEPMA